MNTTAVEEKFKRNEKEQKVRKETLASPPRRPEAGCTEGCTAWSTNDSMALSVLIRGPGFRPHGPWCRGSASRSRRSRSYKREYGQCSGNRPGHCAPVLRILDQNARAYRPHRLLAVCGGPEIICGYSQPCAMKLRDHEH